MLVGYSMNQSSEEVALVPEDRLFEALLDLAHLQKSIQSILEGKNEWMQARLWSYVLMEFCQNDLKMWLDRIKPERSFDSTIQLGAIVSQVYIASCRPNHVKALVRRTSLSSFNESLDVFQQDLSAVHNAIGALGKANSEGTSSLDHDPQQFDDVLSDKQMLILSTLLKLNAIGPDLRVSTRKMSRRAEGNYGRPENFKRSISELVTKQLLGTRTGRSGGCWLTAKGCRRAEMLSKRRTKS